jgi:hypothetical protein
VPRIINLWQWNTDDVDSIFFLLIELRCVVRRGPRVRRAGGPWAWGTTCIAVSRENLLSY